MSIEKNVKKKQYSYNTTGPSHTAGFKIVDYLK